jgi:uncharacterized protein (TIGR00369 family)
MDRRLRCEELVALFDTSPIKRTFGMDLRFNEREEAVLSYPHNAALQHAMGDTHGGVLATLLDCAGWFTAAVPYDRWIATVELQTRLLEPAHREALVATGTLVRAGKSLAVARMEIRAAAGRLVAEGSGTFVVTSLVPRKGSGPPRLM